ncbi:MAG: hypothetical protein QNJ00_13245 [Woeseiaceae bacterium]|nr:hypothetical protein [Woeseiaceae bacterium]
MRGAYGSFHEFATGGQMLLWASRHWMRAHRLDRPLPTCVWQSFAVADMTAGYCRLAELLSVLVFREFPAETFASPSRSRLTRDETLFMEILAALEADEPERALRLLETRAAPAIARTAVLHAAEVVSSLRQAGHRVTKPKQPLAWQVESLYSRMEISKPVLN